MFEHDELIPVFVEESQQHLQTIEPDILELEKKGKDADPEIINRIFRSVHSIKGSSGFFGLNNIGRLSHAMENALTLVREGRLEPSPELVDALLKGMDALRAMLEDVGASEAQDVGDEFSALQALIEGSAEDRRTVKVGKKGEQTDAAMSGLNQFEVPESDIRFFVANQFNLYAIKLFLNADFRRKNKSPFEFINQMEYVGQYVDSFLHIDSVTDLSDCLENELAFDFLFATVLEAESVSKILDIAGDRISEIDLSRYADEVGAAPAPPEPEPAAPETATKTPAPEISSEPAEPEDRPASAEPEAADAPPDDQDAADKKAAAPAGRAVHAEEKIRVGVNYLNDLVNLAGELVLGRNQLMQTALPLVKRAPGLNPVLQHISRVTSEMQEKIMLLRMQPMSLLFAKFHRVVRGLARSNRKEVRLETRGEDVELDKTIIEGLSDPLTHLIRNSVDHGVESPDDREKAGKPRFGVIELNAYHQGGQVHLRISDDGRGVDGDAVAAKALEKGLITQDQLNAMGEKEKIRLIFLPGFSTASEVTDLSGRGVGMDVVQTNIERLGGKVHIETRAGKGTIVTLELPLTLAIVSGLLLKAGEQFFILPEVDIDELVRIKPEEIMSRIDVVQNAWVLRLRDMLLPLVSLNDALGVSKSEAETPDAEQRRTSLAQGGSPLRILVIKHGTSRFGLMVDAIVSTEEIVVKPLPRYLKKMNCFSGVSILGNGMVSLILDVAGILEKTNVRHLEKDVEKERRAETAETALTGRADEQTLLIFDNDTPERFALPLELISRIEKVPAAGIERIKEKQFIQYHGKKLKLIFLEEYLPVSRPDRTDEDAIGVIVPKQVKHPLGVVFHQVINTIDAVVDLDADTITAPGLFGSAVLDGKITLLPDMYRLFELAAPEWYAAAQPAEKREKRKRRVLLAEDTPFFRMVETKYLTSAGYEVLQAEDGLRALQILEEETVDAAILDIVMPKMDGWGVIRAIRSDDRLKDLPVMAVTSLGVEGDPSVMEKGLAAGFDEWELKLDKSRLLEKLAAMMTRKADQTTRG